MAYDQPPMGTLKRKRKRRDDKPAISARLYLDSNLKGEVGVLSEDLIYDLYPGQVRNDGGQVYAAVTPWTPSSSIAESTWSILPCRAQAKDEKQLPPSTIRFPASASGTQSFVNLIHTISPNRTIRQNAAIEVKISDVLPLTLDTIYVSVDADAVDKLEEVRRRYGGGFMSANGYNAKKAGKDVAAELIADSENDEDNTRRLINAALGRMSLVHTGDTLPLDIAHPVTHATAPPAKILACEPVSQGVLAPATKIVITSERRPAVRGGSRKLLSSQLAEEPGEDEDTSNEAFFSATEDGRIPAKPIVTSKSTTDLSNTDDLFDTSAEDSNLSSDEDDLIQLAKPGLTERPSGISSAITSATPRPFGNRTNGMGTPGSVFSNVTASTMRGGSSTKTKTFRAQGLLEHIADELLHPKPASDEDEEARVYVDASALARLGCFSGDWARIEAAENLLQSRFGALGALTSLTDQAWRPVKVYSLPENMSKRPPRYQLNTKQGRRDSISSLATNSTSVATLYLSPILLANLNQPENVSLSPLSPAKRTSIKRPLTGHPGSVSSRLPPTASEMTLRKIVTPLSNERALNNALYANLKEYFERKQRIVKAGDLIAIPVDESLGRSLFEGVADSEDSSSSALLSQWHSGADRPGSRGEKGDMSVAWFSIEAVTIAPSEDIESENAFEIWSGAASIDPTKMTMRQSGDDRRKLPSASENAWPYYLGARRSRPQVPGSGLVATTSIPEQPKLFVSALQRRLRELISVSISPRAIHLGLPPVAILISSTQRNIGKACTVERTCQDLGIHYFPIDAHDIASEGGTGVDTQAQGLLEARCERAMDCGSDVTAICIKHIETLSSDRVATSLKSVLSDSRVLVATTTAIDKVPDSVRSLFTHELEMTAPDEREREGILRDIVMSSGIALGPEVDLGSIAVKTAALVAGDLADVVDRAIVARVERLDALAKSASEQTGWTVTTKDIKLSGGPAANSLIPADFDAAVDLARKNFADAIGAPKIPNVQWSDVGGLTNVKDAVVETIQLPLSRPELFAKGLKKRSGILFYGPPGTGKTLLAKAIATEFSLNFFSVKGPELLNMYIGESEANVRRVFQRARDARPCVVFFDELDSVAPKRGNQGDSGGVMDRIVSQLLAELDGMSDGEENGGGVFVIGATNRPDLLDQALLRPGRFDKMLYLGISDTHEKQATILQALTRKFELDPSLSLPRIAESLPFTFTGADLYALCSDAMLKAVTRSARLVDDKVAAVNSERASRGATKISVAYYFDHFATDEDSHVSVIEDDFIKAKSELVPSVSLDELQHYERVRATFEGTATTATSTTKKTTNGSALTQNGESISRPPTSQSGSSEQAASRAKFKDFMKRAAHLGKDKDRAPAVNGHARGHSATAMIGDLDTDDDYVIRTDKLSLNGHGVSSGGRPVSSKGKGKGKGKDSISSMPQDVKENGEGEDLYD
ncbi:peroxisomal biogenesis factor 6 [Acrodontium crateriforme]|uniref:Peroxisomal ATPase PEX6 n=1 Tax=Acrodontium crateriforme TaxID=150365 RepID=A0AAQ3M1V5_9PEZI|nr:peroxisomal biogenesis factor 6 [Acrodontium crateriforme]